MLALGRASSYGSQVELELQYTPKHVDLEKRFDHPNLFSLVLIKVLRWPSASILNSTGNSNTY